MTTIIGLTANIGDTIYYGSRLTGEVDEMIVDKILIIKNNKDELVCEYYDSCDSFICTEEDLQRNKLLGDYIYCTHEALRNAYLLKEKIGD